MTKCGDLSVEEFNNYFITAVDTSDTILTHHWKNEQAEQSQLILPRPLTDDEVLKHNFSLQKKNCWDGWHRGGRSEKSIPNC